MVRRTLVMAAIGAALCSLQGSSAMAGDVHVGPVTAYVEVNIRAWIEDPIIVDELKRSERAPRPLDADRDRWP